MNTTNQVIVLTIMMMVGVFLRKKQIITDVVIGKLTFILINVTLPAMIIASFNFEFSMDLLKNASMMFLYSCIIHSALIALSTLSYLRCTDSKKCVLAFSTVFSNCGFVGFPIIQGLFGNIGVFYTSIFCIPFNIFMWSYGVTIFTGEKDVRNMIRKVVNIPFLCTGIGICLFLFSVKLPVPILAAAEKLGGMTTPISMFIIGAMLADVRPRDVFKGIEIYYMSFLKLIVAPLLCYAILRLLQADPMLICICVVLIAMPTASLVGVFAEMFNADRVLSSRCAFLTTVLSMVSVPLVSMIF